MWNMVVNLIPLYRAIAWVQVDNGATTFLWFDDQCSIGPSHQLTKLYQWHSRTVLIRISQFSVRFLRVFLVLTSKIASQLLHPENFNS